MIVIHTVYLQLTNRVANHLISIQSLCLLRVTLCNYKW